MATSTLNTTQKSELRVKQARMGLWLFFATQSMFFFSMLVAKGMLLGPGQPIGVAIVLPVIMTVLLLLSSITIQLAESAASEGKPALLQQMLAATMLLGLGFVIGLGWLWLTFPFSFSTPWGLVFYTMTGLHVIHLLIGEGILLRVLLKARAGAYTPENYWGVQGTARFWHFLGIIWLIYFAALYII